MKNNRDYYTDFNLCVVCIKSTTHFTIYNFECWELLVLGSVLQIPFNYRGCVCRKRLSDKESKSVGGGVVGVCSK